MKSKWSNLSLVAIAAPIIFLACIYGSLPDTVPIHFNWKGEPDGWGPKYWLWALALLPLLLTAVTFYAIGKARPGEVWTAKYQHLGTVMATSMAGLVIYLLIGTMRGGFPGYSGLSVILGIVFAGSGNYLPIIPPNKWVGIRVPRTLKHKDVWEKTHRYGGRVFLICGLLLILNGLLIPPPVVNITMLVLLGFATALPLLFAYRTEPEQDELV